MQCTDPAANESVVGGAWGSMVGRTVAGVVRGRQHEELIVYICFDDGTAFGIFGTQYSGATHLRFKSVRQAREDFEREGSPPAVDTAIAPPLDLRRTPWPEYLGTPDPEVVRIPPVRPDPAAGLVEWDEVAEAAPAAFDVWVGDAEVAWAREAWSVLGDAGLTSYRDGLEQVQVHLRFIALSEVHRDFCAIAWQEVTEGWLGETAEAIGLSPFALGQLVGPGFDATWEDGTLSMEEAVAEGVARVRPGVVRALRAHHGSDDALFLWMWVANDPDCAGMEWQALDDDEVYEVLNTPTAGRCEAYAWITRGMEPYR